jgi:PhnB protein
MATVSLDPYIFFNGNAREAMEFYKGVFGGELAVTLFDEMPSPDMPENLKGKVMHAMLNGGDVKLMASDSGEASERAAKIELSLSGDDEEKLTNYFNKLSEGGKVKSPLKKEAWGDTFGQFTDKYNIDWMINISTPKA